MPLEGYVDSCIAGQISGWVWDSDRPDARVVVEIYLDGGLLDRLDAQTYRKDLEDAGIGDGGHGFSYHNPSLSADAAPRISVKAADTSFNLVWSKVAGIDFGALLSLDDPFRTPSFAEIVKATGAFKPASYLPIYDRLMEPLRSLSVNLLELGINDGGSLRAWATYFPYGQVAGVDLNIPPIPPHDRIRMFQGDQADTALLGQIAAELAPNGFDVIIDDCAHIGAPAKTSFWYLFENHLKPGALYIIEDWETGYWPWWPDGRSYTPEPDTRDRMPSHDAGMVGFIKQLMDEVGGMPADAPRQPKISSLTLHPGVCIIRKAVLKQ